jgi:hypothetical protein
MMMMMMYTDDFLYYCLNNFLNWNKKKILLPVFPKYEQRNPGFSIPFPDINGGVVTQNR